MTDFKKPNPALENAEGIQRIRKSLLHLFDQSKGYEFRVKGSVITDFVKEVYFELNLVRGEQYGTFHIDLCELTGSKKEGNQG
jgi:hypothetical protein